MPLDLGQIAGIQTKFQLYTVPGQIYYKSTRRLVLQGVDGIVFVADSSRAKLRENKESLADLEENLKEMGKELTDVPIIIQYNKRDIPDAMPVEELEKELNPNEFPYVEAVAPRGEGVFPTLKKLASMVLEAVNKGGLATARSRGTPGRAKVNRAAATAKASPKQAAPASAPPKKAAISRPQGGVPSAPKKGGSPRVAKPAAAATSATIAAAPHRERSRSRWWRSNRWRPKRHRAPKSTVPCRTASSRCPDCLATDPTRLSSFWRLAHLSQGQHSSC